MGFFSARPKGRPGGLPANIVEQMDAFGRFEFDPHNPASPVGGTIWPNIVAPLFELSRSDGSGFLAALASELLPAGGWAVYGGERLVKELFSGDLDDPSYHAMMAAALDFLRSLGLPNSRLNNYEWRFWLDHKGKEEPWLTSRPLPNPELTRIRPLSPGEDRLVAQIEAAENSNRIHVRADGEGRFVAEIDAAYSDDDPTRSRGPWHTATSLYDLYRQVAESFQVPTYWYDDELEPFFPYPKPAIDWLPAQA
jgi:hypothetical protein